MSTLQLLSFSATDQCFSPPKVYTRQKTRFSLGRQSFIEMSIFNGQVHCRERTVSDAQFTSLLADRHIILDVCNHHSVRYTG